VVDLAAAIAALLDAGGVLDNSVSVVNSRMAASLALKRDTAGGPAFPSITINGGTLGGLPVFVSASVPRSVSGGAIVVLLATDAVLVADDAIRIDQSRETSLQMDSAPSSSAQPLVPMWQNDLVAFRVERRCN
jgi:hypothetical protein